MIAALPYREIWLADFEFIARPGERPDPVCLVAHELKTGRKLRLWRDQFGPRPPYSTDAQTLFVAYYASAELGCHRVLGWPMPARVLDLFTEFRRHTNGLGTPAGLLGALCHFGLDSIGAAEKTEMRDLVLRGGPWSAAEQAAILGYCEGDVVALGRLLLAMLPTIDLPRALLRGRYMAACAVMEDHGVPIDVPLLQALRRHWEAIKGRLIVAIDRDYTVFEGTTFKADRFEAYLVRQGIPWPRTETGRLATDDDTFREAAKAYPQLAPLRELRHALAELRLQGLAVGPDGRNRCLLSPFRARSGRNQPSNTKSIFGPSVWLRGLVKPPPGYGVAYIDWSQQEFGIAAVLSGDAAMLTAYRSGDPYLAFAKQAGAVPADATKATYSATRELFKTCALGVHYGMEAESLAARIGQVRIVALDLLRAHHETYRTFWKWSDAAVDHALLSGSLHSVFGWVVHVGPDPNPRSLRNFPMQANGAEMLRVACCLATEAGLEVLAPVHDALLIGAPIELLPAAIDAARACMAEASRAVLGGFELRTDVSIVCYPDRYSDPRGRVMWATVTRLLAELDQVEGRSAA